jgi:large subunit ribosomal protein L24
MARHIRKGDLVMVTAGDYKGQTGEVAEVITKSDRVLVKGVNVRKRHVKPTQLNPQGGIIEKEMPLHISNVSPIVDGKPTRVRFEVKTDGSKVRVAARGGKVLGEIRGPKKK